MFILFKLQLLTENSLTKIWEFQTGILNNVKKKLMCPYAALVIFGRFTFFWAWREGIPRSAYLQHPVGGYEES